jgi:hypothetical protein
VSEQPTYTAGIDIETNHDEGEGTLGCFAQDKNGKPVLLSCSHVIFPGFKVIDNMGVFQPKYSSCCSNGAKIAVPVFDKSKKAKKQDDGGWVEGYHEGTWTGGFNSIAAPGQPSEVDCAIAKLDPGIKFHNLWRVKAGEQTTDIPLKGTITEGLGIVMGPPLGTAPSAAQYVRVYSQNSGKLSYGTMLSVPSAGIPHADDPDKLLFRLGISDPSDKRAGIKTSVNQFLILPRPTPVPGQSYVDSYNKGEKLTFDHGDSGTVVINHQNLVIAMVIRKYDVDQILKLDRSKMEFAEVGSFAIATPILPILNHLQIKIPSHNAGWSGTGASAGAGARIFVPGMPADPAFAGVRQGLDRLRQGLRRSRRGKFLLAKVEQHRREVRRLLAGVREIAAAWHDLGGAAVYSHCVRNLADDEHRIPEVINGVTRERLAETLVTLVARHASPALSRDLTRYRAWAIATVLPISTLREVPPAVARRWPAV